MLAFKVRAEGPGAELEEKPDEVTTKGPAEPIKVFASQEVKPGIFDDEQPHKIAQDVQNNATVPTASNATTVSETELKKEKKESEKNSIDNAEQTVDKVAIDRMLET